MLVVIVLLLGCQAVGWLRLAGRGGTSFLVQWLETTAGSHRCTGPPHCNDIAFNQLKTFRASVSICKLRNIYIYIKYIYIYTYIYIYDPGSGSSPTPLPWSWSKPINPTPSVEWASLVKRGGGQPTVNQKKCNW